MKFFQVFKAGAYPQGDFSKDDVNALASNYDPKFCEAPLTLDHEQRGPAYGWVSELKAENGILKASFRDVTGELKEFVQSGKYRKISVEIYKEIEGRKPYLKAVSFLGAGIPQVKGMEPVEFKDGESEIYIFELEEPAKKDIAEMTEKPDKAGEFVILKEIIKIQNQIAEIESRVSHMAHQPGKDDELISALQEKVQALSAQMKEFELSENLFLARQKSEQELADLKQKMRSSEFEQFLSEQELSGNLTPGQKELSLKLFTALDNVKKVADCEQRLERSEMPFNASNQADESDYIEEFKNFIKTLPKQIDRSEFATKKNRTHEMEITDFSNASEDSLAIYTEAKQLAEKENIPFKDALLRLYE